MKTLYLSELSEEPEPGTYFVIGVRAGDADEEEDGDDSSSLERFQRNFPETRIERYPEVINPKYIKSEYRANHILQPAFVTFL